MTIEGKFLVYCLEIYRAEKKLTGKQVITLFKQYDVIDYIMSCFGALSTTGKKYRSEERRVGKECRSRWSPYH